MMVSKDVDGKLEKWQIKKVYPIDQKDKKINELEEEVKKLKEVIDNEHRKSNEPIRKFEQSDGNVDGNAKPKPKAMASECEDNEMRNKYMNVSNTLFELFMVEHNNIGKIFKEE